MSGAWAKIVRFSDLESSHAKIAMMSTNLPLSSVSSRICILAKTYGRFGSLSVHTGPKHLVPVKALRGFTEELKDSKAEVAGAGLVGPLDAAHPKENQGL